MIYEVSVAAQPRRPIAAVAATTTWERFPGQWPGMLDEVYACLRRAGVKSGCNVMIYRDLPEADRVDVEVGVEVNEPFPPYGMVIVSACLVRLIGVMRWPGGSPGHRINRTAPIHRGNRRNPSAGRRLREAHGSVIPGGLELPRLLDRHPKVVPEREFPGRRTPQTERPCWDQGAQAELKTWEESIAGAISGRPGEPVR